MVWCLRALGFLGEDPDTPSRSPTPSAYVGWQTTMKKKNTRNCLPVYFSVLSLADCHVIDLDDSCQIQRPLGVL